MAAIDIHRIREAAAGEDIAIETVDETGSTNRVLMESPFGLVPASPRLLAAARQTAGRGRRGRGWVMEPGRSVAFSLAIERTVAATAPPPSGLSIAVGVAIAQALAAYAPELRLKWPNDLQRDGRKLGGILVESRRGAGAASSIERLVIGIGINLSTPRDPDAAIGQAVTGLFDSSSRLVAANSSAQPLTPEAVIGLVAAAANAAVRHLLAEGLAPFRATWQQFDALYGQPVVLLDHFGAVVQQGTARGIDESGALLLETADGVCTVSSGEVSLRALRSPAGDLA
ncbi:MAG TPA: biotin--[acetyl-CoA-carboxylase] ligase [Burkholderiaceae bacterium]|nr:biotin--[acetyl-CoA-carboxylase] ligase [Burkholderiaceae bacterium]